MDLPMSRSDEELSVEELDEQIRFLEEQSSLYLKRARELRAKRNTRIQSTMLTEHVLQYIFTLLAHDPTRLMDKWDSMKVSHVCRRWREIAINTKEVWSNIFITRVPLSLKRLHQFLRRSKNADLSITYNSRFNITSERWGDLLYELEPHRTRITELRILDIPDSFWNDEDSKDASATFEGLIGDRLQHLVIESYQDRFYGWSREETTDNILAYATFSPKLLSSSSLTKIDLTGFSLEPSFNVGGLPLLDNVIELAFQRAILYSPPLLGLIRKCPRLKSLSLVQCKTYYDEQLTEDVSLPYLEELRLQGMAIEAIFWLLRCLRLPDTSNWTIECNPDRDQINTFCRADPQLLLRRFPSCDSLDIVLLCDSFRIESTSAIETGNEVIPIKYVKTSYLIRCRSNEDIDGAFNRVLDYLPQSNWKTACKLQFETYTFDDETITEHMWADLLVDLDNLTSLGIRFHHQDRSKTGEGFLNALRYNDPPDTHEDGQFAFCPSLKELSLTYDKYPTGFLSDLERMLDDRRRWNIPIHQLWLNDITGLEEEVSRISNLRRFVSQLHYNAVDTDMNSST